MPRIVHTQGPFGGRHVVETTTIDPESLIAAHDEGLDALDIEDRWPALPEGSMEAALAWRDDGRPRHARVSLSSLGFVVEGSQATAKMLLALHDHGDANEVLQEAVEAALAWRASYDEIAMEASSFDAMMDAGPEIWMHLSEDERLARPGVLGVSPAERYGATHGGYAALVWLPETSSLRIVPILSNGPDAIRDRQYEIDVLLEIGRAMLITWHRREASPSAEFVDEDRLEVVEEPSSTEPDEVDVEAGRPSVPLP